MLPTAAIAAFASAFEGLAQPETSSSELEELWERVRSAWPQYDLAPEEFFRFLGARAVLVGSLKLLHATDLYLACACLAGKEPALLAFDVLLEELGRKVRRAAGSNELLEEAKQMVRHVLLARGERPAALAQYGGRGELGGWLRIALTRELVLLARRAGREGAADGSDLAALAHGDDDPESRYFKTHYQKEFRESFAVAMGRLRPDERRLLRYSIVERLSIDDIARLESTHRATSARQLARARLTLADQTHQVLRERLRISAAELESVLRLIESQVDVSVRRLLTG